MLARAIGAAAAAATLASAAAGQDYFDAGAREFRDNCAACHGEDGRGGGPMAEILSIPTPDLTRMAERRDGRLDPMELFAFIDGRADVRAHGDPMPIWGSRFRAEAELFLEPVEAEIAARVRLLELAFYLMSIQRGGYPTGYAADGETGE